ncbi:MAG: hypothetical protein H7308_11885 [Chthonomonadaceae bacterium]|nr:hypothetical protein [Chthonomonadaceae bacterium]
MLNISQKREVFHRALLSSGLVKRLATPRTEEEGERYMIMVQGEPLSKTILQERRKLKTSVFYVHRTTGEAARSEFIPPSSV